MKHLMKRLQKHTVFGILVLFALTEVSSAQDQQAHVVQYNPLTKPAELVVLGKTHQLTCRDQAVSVYSPADRATAQGKSVTFDVQSTSVKVSSEILIHGPTEVLLTCEGGVLTLTTGSQITVRTSIPASTGTQISKP